MMVSKKNGFEIVNVSMVMIAMVRGTFRIPLLLEEINGDYW